MHDHSQVTYYNESIFLSRSLTVPIDIDVLESILKYLIK